VHSLFPVIKWCKFNDFEKHLLSFQYEEIKVQRITVKFYFKTFLLIVVLAVSACHPRNSIPTIDLYPAKSVDIFPDTANSNFIYDMKYYNDRVFILNSNEGRILVTDQDLNMLYSFGQQGDDPGELTNPLSFAVWNDSVYVNHTDGTVINVFTLEGDFVRTFTIESGISFREFSIHDNQVIATTSVSDSSGYLITFLDLQGNYLRSFGDIEPEKRQQSRFRYRPLFVDQNQNILSVPLSLPKVELYRMDGTMLDELDLIHEQVMREHFQILQELQRERMQSGTDAFVFTYSGASYYRRLYLSTTADEEEFSPVIVVTVHNQKLLPASILNLHADSTGTNILDQKICVTSDNILAFDWENG